MMKNLDLYWKSNKNWWEYRNHVPVIKESAPIEAQISYKNYLEQMSN